MPWFLLYPAIAAALGAGAAKATGRDWKKGAMLGAGLGLGAGALAPAAAGGAGGWGALTGGAGAADTLAANQALMQAAPSAELGKTLASAGAAKGAAATGWGQLAKQAAVSTALGGAASAAMPKYGQTQLMVNPGFLQPMQEDPMVQLQQLMSKKGRIV